MLLYNLLFVALTLQNRTIELLKIRPKKELKEAKNVLANKNLKMKLLTVVR